MNEIERAIELGFWPRLMGYLSAARNPNSARVAELASDSSTGVQLSNAQAGQLINMGRQARSAARSWLTNAPVGSFAIPQANLPASASIDGGEPGPHEVGLIAKIGKGQTLPMQFSTDVHTTPFQRIVYNIEEFITAICGGESEKRLRCLADQSEAKKVLDDWLSGKTSTILPDYIVERIGR